MAQSQWTLAVHKNTKKKETIKAIKLRILKAKELIIKGTKAKLKILAEEDI